jgi:hypothetical protein
VSTTTPIPLAPEDRAILEVECATVAGHACKVVVLGEGAPGAAALREAVGARLDRAPELTMRLGEVDGVPAWVPAGDVRLADHVAAAPVDAPLDAAGLRREVARLFAERLDRSRPLWRMDVAPLEGGGAAVIWRTHHALADGTTAMRLADEVLWEPASHEAAPAAPRRPAAGAADDHARRRGHLAGFLRREVGPPGHASPFDGSIGNTRRVAFASLPLEALHRAARSACGATVNDAVLCVVAGGIRRWLEAQGGRLSTIRMRVPVSLHHEGDHAANRDSFFSVPVPLDEPDAVMRLRAVHDATAVRKADHDAETLEEVMHGLDRMSPELRRLARRMQASPRAFALAVSNVVGPRADVSVGGASVRRLYSVAEIGRRHALRACVVSLAGTLHLGLLADPALVDDVEGMARGVADEAQALIAAAE